MTRINLGPEGNAARRKFWEMCASQALLSIQEDVYEDFHKHEKFYDKPEFAASWADEMVKQWEMRWTVEEDKT